MLLGRTAKLFLLGLVAVLGVTILFAVVHPFGSDTVIHFPVRRGISAHEIADELQTAGLIRHPLTFLVWVKVMGARAIRPGVYDLSPRQSGYSIYRELLKGPKLIRITFPEGWTAKQMAALLETKGVTTAGDFLANVDKNKFEGYLFPDTYYFEQGLPADRVTARLCDRFKQKEPADFKASASALHLSYTQLVTLASIVEREARAPQERPIIAGVFLNRLKKHMYLESCATVEYALGGWRPRLTYKDLDVVSPYNTYRHGGLPPGPICNPGLAALVAAAHPSQTDMLFFVADGQGTHRFTRYYNEHLAAQGVHSTKPDANKK